MTVARLGFWTGTTFPTEGSGGGITHATFTIRRSGSLIGAVSVDWSLLGVHGIIGTAADEADFAVRAGTLTFAHGEASRVLSVPLRADGEVEDTEGYAILLSNPTGGAIVETPIGVAAIVDDDTQFSIGADSTPPEGTGGVTPYVFTVERTGLATLGQSVAWRALGADFGWPPGATAEDFAGGAFPGGVLSFAPGETSKTLTVDIAADAFREEGESFVVVLSAPTGGATLGTSVAFASIQDDDPQGPPGGGTPGQATLAFAPGAPWGVEGTGTAATPIDVTVLRRGNSAGAVAVDWAVMGASGIGWPAVSDADFLVRSGRLTFAPGETSRVLSLQVRADAVGEFTEEFAVVLSNPSAGAGIETPATWGRIQDDDTSFMIRQRPAEPADVVGGIATHRFTIHRAPFFTGGTQQTQSVSWSVASALGEELPPARAEDFAGGAFPSGTVTFAPGETQKTVTFDVLGGTSARLGGGYIVALSAPTGGASLGQDPFLGGPAALGIIFGGGYGARFAVAATDRRLAEGHDGVTQYRFSVTRGSSTGPYRFGNWPAHVHSVGWAVVGHGGRPADAGDFEGGVLPSGRITFAPGEFTRIITVPVMGDRLPELDEAFGIVLSDPSQGAELGTALATATIANDDDAGTTGVLSIAAMCAARAEGQGGATGFSFLVTRGGNVLGSASATWSVAAGSVPGTMPAGAADFAGGVLPQGTVSFAPGETRREISITVAGDLAREFNESFNVVLSGVPAGVSLGVASARGIILDDDAPGSGTLSIAPLAASRPEGDGGATPFRFLVSRDGDASGWAAADWAVIPPDYHLSAEDFVGGIYPSGRVILAPGERSRVVTVNVAGDAEVELDGWFSVALSAPQAGVALAGGAATGVVRNDDLPATGTLGIARVNAARGEGQGGVTAFTFVVTRTGDISGIASAGWSVAGGGVGGTVAINGADVEGGVLPSGSVSFAPGETARLVTIPILGDGAMELNESFTVSLSAVPPGVEVAAASATGVVWNDDTPGSGTLSIAPAGAFKAEGAPQGSTVFGFVVTRTGDLSRMAAADWRVEGGTAGGTVAANGADFAGGQLPGGRVVFAAGQASQAVTVHVSADMAAELNESFAVVLANPQAGVGLGTASATGVILNDDIASTAADQALSGTQAADVFLLGGGRDTVLGGAGVDLFLLQPAALGVAAAAATEFLDFDPLAGERLNLTGIDAVAATPGDDVFAFIGTEAFNGTPGQLRWEEQGAFRLIQGNVNADTTADLTLLVRAAGPVEAGWFVL